MNSSMFQCSHVPTISSTSSTRLSVVLAQHSGQSSPEFVRYLVLEFLSSSFQSVVSRQQRERREGVGLGAESGRASFWTPRGPPVSTVLYADEGVQDCAGAQRASNAAEEASPHWHNLLQ